MTCKCGNPIVNFPMWLKGACDVECRACSDKTYRRLSVTNPGSLKDGPGLGRKPMKPAPPNPPRLRYEHHRRGY